ncbi:DUF952 domain-containing protein [Nocardioides immobilis]|uniref:DUF952 domain-containing protein n=1 Tax=Nocardioides immobilis TaxID=2049295 RepID=A0A417Y2H9_9ACTN|nr:DUF952 domain-containing protein [Nocardioides immobilis]RHW26868.1 DUF952 domain-containing protein [Nocardioides immobilis]
MATIFHLALASDWAAAQDAGAYTVSTLGRTLAEEGFIHASRGDQWPTVRDRFYADVTAPLLLLQIDTDRLDVPVVEETAAPGSPETFPHIYGPLALDAVVKAIPVPVRGSVTTPATPPATPHATPPAPTGDSFGRFFLSEMLVNMALLILILVTTAIGVSVGSAIGGDIALVAGLAVGVLVGGGLARWLYVRRHA